MDSGFGARLRRDWHRRSGVRAARWVGRGMKAQEGCLGWGGGVLPECLSGFQEKQRCMLAKARAPPLVQGDVLLRFSSLSLEIQRGQRVGGWGGGGLRGCRARAPGSSGSLGCG